MNQNQSEWTKTGPYAWSLSADRDVLPPSNEAISGLVAAAELSPEPTMDELAVLMGQVKLIAPNTKVDAFYVGRFDFVSVVVSDELHRKWSLSIARRPS